MNKDPQADKQPLFRLLINQYAARYIFWLLLSTLLWRLLSGHWPNANRRLIDIHA